MPPVENLWKYTEMGFDLVCFSGGKGIRGPQNAGLLLGKKHLIDLARENDSPNSAAVGRGMKVAKEQIIGMVAAVDWTLDQPPGAMDGEYERRVKVIADAVKECAVDAVTGRCAEDREPCASSAAQVRSESDGRDGATGGGPASS